ESGFHIRHAGVLALLRRKRRPQKLCRFGLGHEARIAQERRGEPVQARFARDLRLGAALRLVGKIEILEPLLGVRRPEGRLELGRELALSLDAREYRRSPLLQLAQIAESLLERAQ